MKHLAKENKIKEVKAMKHSTFIFITNFIFTFTL